MIIILFCNELELWLLWQLQCCPRLSSPRPPTQLKLRSWQIRSACHFDILSIIFAVAYKQFWNVFSTGNGSYWFYSSFSSFILWLQGPKLHVCSESAQIDYDNAHRHMSDVHQFNFIIKHAIGWLISSVQKSVMYVANTYESSYESARQIDWLHLRIGWALDYAGWRGIKTDGKEIGYLVVCNS